MINKQLSFVVGAVSLLTSVLAFCLIALWIDNNYVPNVYSLVMKAREISVASAFWPEPVERLIFLCGLILLPFFLTLSLWIVRYGIDRAPKRIIDNVYFAAVVVCGAAITALLYLGLSAHAGPYQPSEQSCYNFYFHNSFLYLHPLLYSLILFPLMVKGLFWLDRCERTGKRSVLILANLIMAIFGAMLLAVVFLMNIFSINSVTNSPVFTVHFNAFFYPVSQVCAGKALLVDLTNQYGLYPHILKPIFSVIGLSIFKFTIVIATLQVLTFASLYFFLRIVVKDSAIRFLGFASIVIWGYILVKLSGGDYYFQYTPLRMIFPCLILFLATNYYYRQGRIPYYLTSVLSAVAVLWNPDSGLVVLLAWTASLCYRELFHCSYVDMLVGSIKQIVNVFGVFAAVSGSYLLAIYLGHGTFPDLSMATGAITMFYGFGFYMLPMPLIHPWNIIILIYLVGLVVALQKCFSRDNSPLASAILLISLMGIGLFSYYQGRSHSYNLISAGYPALLLLTIFAGKLWDEIKSNSQTIYHEYLLFFPMIYFLSFSIFSPIVNIRQISSYIDKGASPIIHDGAVAAEHIAFVKAHTTMSEQVIIISGNQGVYYAESGTSAYGNSPGLTEILLKDDLVRLAALINDKNNLKLFIDLQILRIPEYGYLQLLFREIEKSYHVIAVNSDKALLLLEKNQ